MSSSSSSGDSDDSSDSDSEDVKKKQKKAKKDAKKKKKNKKKKKQAKKKELSKKNAKKAQKAEKKAKKALKKAQKALEVAQHATMEAKRDPRELVKKTIATPESGVSAEIPDKPNGRRHAKSPPREQDRVRNVRPRLGRSCPDCGQEIEWSNFVGDIYKKGWICNNVEFCGSKARTKGQWRWNCQTCTNDFCSDCKGLPDDQSRVRKCEEPDLSESERSAARTTASQPPSSSDEESDPDVHIGALCASCNMEPIRGPRFRCSVCSNVSLCRLCYKKKDKVHTPGHKFFAMKVVVQLQKEKDDCLVSDCKPDVEPQHTEGSVPEDVCAGIERQQPHSPTSEKEVQHNNDDLHDGIETTESAMPIVIDDTEVKEAFVEESAPALTASELQERWQNLGKTWQQGENTQKRKRNARTASPQKVSNKANTEQTEVEETVVDPEREVCFIRHAQAFHNVQKTHIQVRDNPLTEDGLDECRKARKDWASKIFSTADLIIVSPLRRALQTAIELINNDTSDKRFMITALCTERWSARCDEGTRKSQLVHEFPWLKAWQGVEELSEIWWPQKRENIVERCNTLISFLRKRSERNIVVVSHGAILTYIIGYRLANAGYHAMKVQALKLVEPLRPGRPLLPNGQCSICLKIAFDASAGVVCKRRLEDGELRGCGQGVCWPCMGNELDLIGKLRITQNDWNALGFNAWWMHEKCMTSVDKQDYSVAMKGVVTCAEEQLA